MRCMKRRSKVPPFFIWASDAWLVDANARYTFPNHLYEPSAGQSHTLRQSPNKWNRTETSLYSPSSVYFFFFEKENSSRSLAEVFISSAPCCSCFFDNSMLVNVWRIRFSKRTLFDCFAILIRVSAGRVRLES